jgi:hypothetical protein
MTMHKGWKEKRPEPSDYKTDEEYENAIVSWMYKNELHLPTPGEPEEGSNQEPAMQYYLRDIDSSEKSGSGQKQDKKPAPSEGSPKVTIYLG